MIQTLAARIQLAKIQAEEGQALVEYALILALISVVAIGVLEVIGVNVTSVLGRIGTDDRQRAAGLRRRIGKLRERDGVGGLRQRRERSLLSRRGDRRDERGQHRQRRRERWSGRDGGMLRSRRGRNGGPGEEGIRRHLSDCCGQIIPLHRKRSR